MKSTIAFRQAGALLGCSIGLSAFAGEFINLGFDNPISTALPYSELVIDPQHGNYTRYYGHGSDLLTGWSLTPDKVYYYDSVSGPVGPGVTLCAGGVVGKFSLFVKGSDYSVSQGETPLEVRMSQRGVIPDTGDTLSFYENAPGHEVKVSLDGNHLPVFLSGARPSVNVSPFAGKEVTLDLTFPEYYYGAFDIYGFFDRNGNLITIPEPSTYALFGLGSAGLGWWLRRKRGEA